MRRRSLLRGFLPAAIASGPAVLYAETYLTTAQAQAVLCPGERLTPMPVVLTAEQQKAIAKASDVRVRDAKVNASRTSSGGWFIVDNVLGKHEFIDFAVSISKEGAVRGVEVLTYRETYGGEVRHPKWRAQFHGKKAGTPLKIDTDIKNISGATLSSVHITEGVRRLLQTHALVLSKL